ncbi:FAD/NAD(P)-binding domain-containing protein [Zopfia rhizophila CBS 207.26]|uniref:FAD/NAD(P)-binding domain-containing protein n=1 Tax=Zopfia rhizophila CBS 207.26 TaxID=1314779 RepID=A0A6A6DQM0_9PEZI|nr:FAD/NAD(P)-binding domain-containing protein [Zopfia rhizophila CBS 207.26]
MGSIPDGISNGQQAAAYQVNEAPCFSPKKLRVACIGAGFSGIYMAMRLGTQACLENVDFQCYEKNENVGGTWFENRYPGCACDVPSHVYCYTFAPNPRWSNYFSSWNEIGKYLEDVSEKYHCSRFIKLRHKVESAVWNEESAKWDLTIMNDQASSFRDSCDVLLNGAGILNNWKWPSIKGLEIFKGATVHSAAWPKDLKISDQRIAVIGSGSSAIQIIPSIQPIAKRVDAYLRSRTWIQPKELDPLVAERRANGLSYEYTTAEKAAFENPQTLLEYRKKLESNFNSLYNALLKSSETQKGARIAFREDMEKKLSRKPELIEKLIPDWEVGCRRLTPGLGYLEALCEDNVDVVANIEIAEVTETGITDANGVHREVDVLVCATGFDVSFKPHFGLVGRGGRDLSKDVAWGENPQAYLTLAIPDFPNYFVFNGPNACVGNGSLIPVIETAGEYMIKAISRIQQHGARSLEVQREAVADLTEHIDVYMPRTVWSGNCRSWYKNGTVDGRVTAIWPGSSLHFMDVLKNPRWEDFKWTYDSGNRFSFLGNGYVNSPTVN